MTQKLLTGGLVLALAAVFLLGLYYLKCLKRMQKLLRDYQEIRHSRFFYYERDTGVKTGKHFAETSESG